MAAIRRLFCFERRSLGEGRIKVDRINRLCRPARMSGGALAAYTQGEHGYGTHYIVLAHELNLAERPQIVSDTQHVEFRWMSPLEIASSPDVHPNTQAYFVMENITSDKRQS